MDVAYRTLVAEIVVRVGDRGYGSVMSAVGRGIGGVLALVAEGWWLVAEG